MEKLSLERVIELCDNQEHIAKRVYEDKEVDLTSELSVLDRYISLTYGCDVCSKRNLFEEDTIWLNSSFGVCYECKDTFTEEELEEIYNR